MNNPDDNRLLNAFVDGELDLRDRLEIETRMRAEPGLSRRIEELGQVRAAIRAEADYHRAPQALRQRFLAGTAPAPARPETGGMAASVRRWPDWRPLVGSLGLVVLLSVATTLAWQHSSQEQRLLDDVVASHVRSTMGEHLVDVASSDHHTVKPWLASKLDFSPPVEELALPGLTFAGGRVDYLDGHPVAALVYRKGEHVVNSFVWPTEAGDTGTAYKQMRGFQTAHWSRGGMTRWVISDVNRVEFEGIVRAVQGEEAVR